MKSKETRAKIGAEGRYLFTTYNLRSKEAKDLDRQIAKNIAERDKIYDKEKIRQNREEFYELMKQLDKFKIKQTKYKNLITNAGLQIVLQRLAGNTSANGVINYGAFGNSQNQALSSDTKLGNETMRRVATYSEIAGTTLSMNFYFSKADGILAATEFGAVIDGTTTKDTGVLFSHMNGNWSKTASESLSITASFSMQSL